MTEKNCKNCRFWYLSDGDYDDKMDIVCNNDISEHKGRFTQPEFVCPFYEQRAEDDKRSEVGKALLPVECTEKKNGQPTVLTVMALFNMCLNLLPDNFPTHLVFMGWLTCFTIEIASFGELIGFMALLIEKMLVGIFLYYLLKGLYVKLNTPDIKELDTTDDDKQERD